MFRGQPLLLRGWHASMRLATRLWYGSPAAMMAAYLVLAVAASVAGGSADMKYVPGGYVWILVLAYFCWRVLRHGWISRGILIYLSSGDVVKAAQLAQWRQIGALAMSLAGLFLLLSPAVYVRTHPGCDAASSSLRLRPTRWMIWSAPLAGTAVAGVTLAVTHRWYLPHNGCMIAPVQGLPPHCVGVGRGFPVPVVSTIHGQHAVSQLAFVQDCVQWTVLIFLVSYLLWLAVHRRHPPAESHQVDAGLVARPS